MREARVSIETPGGERYVFRVDSPSFTIGRHNDCDLSLPSPEVSARHARFDLDWHDECVFVTDLGSKNGTWLGDRRLPTDLREPLPEGQRVRIAEVSVGIAFGDAEETSSQSLSLESGASLSRALLRGLLGRVLRRSRARLEVKAGPARGSVLVLDEEVEQVTLGGGPNCDLDLAEPALAEPLDASAALTVRRAQHRYELIPPIGVGVRLAGRPLEGTHPLRDGDTVRVGKTRIVFSDPLQGTIDELARLSAGEEGETRPRRPDSQDVSLAGASHADPRFLGSLRQPPMTWRVFGRAERLALLLAILSIAAALLLLLIALDLIVL